MQDYEIDAYLGDTTVTEDQRAALRTALDQVAARFPEQGDTSATDAGAGAAMIVLGDVTLDVLAQQWARARREEREEWAKLVGAMIGAAATGMPETRIAETAGVARMTVRKALGK